jgi:hypothetical protein
VTGPTEDRFFIDHGMIHDTVTGKHVTTDEDTVGQDGIVACTDLLNELHRGHVAAGVFADQLRYATKVLNSYPPLGSLPTREELGKLVYDVFYGGPIGGAKERIADAILARLKDGPKVAEAPSP